MIVRADQFDEVRTHPSQVASTLGAVDMVDEDDRLGIGHPA